ncbi:hypothetical protein K1X76_06180 [bacterium]|nr:hypothetical protein [bacterium]
MSDAINNNDDLRTYCELSASWYSGWEISLHHGYDVWSIREANYKRYMDAYNSLYGMCECPTEETGEYDTSR